MLNKKLIMLTIFLVCLLAVSTVNAADNNASNVVGVDDTIDEVVSVENDDQVTGSIEDKDDSLSANSDGSFTDLANDIANANRLLMLSRNYAYDSSKDSNYTNGIVIDKELMIYGFGFTINGNNQARAFNVSSSKVTLINIEFINCSDSTGGGAVYWNGANGTLSYCNFVNCYSSGAGGAVYWKGSSGRIVNCTFVGNSVSYGESSGKMGGAVYWKGVEGVIVNSTFDSNSAFGGGAVGWWADSGWIVNSSFINNHAGTYGRSGSGGAVEWVDGSGVIVNCTFVNNYAATYGGAVDWGSANSRLVNSTFVNNYVSGYGGAVYCHAKGDVIYNCTFDRNHASEWGGAVYWYGDYGGIEKSTFVNNYAPYGGAVYWTGYNGGFVNSTFVNNYATRYGGGAVYWTGDYGVLVNSTFVNNSATQYNGGAVYWTGDYGVLVNSSFVNNSAITGGAVYRGSGYGYTIRDSVVLDGIYVRGNLESVNTWFGNNASNYENKSYSNCESWLFLNASSVPIAGVNSKSTVTFTLDNLYNSSSNTISHPDISNLPDVVFSLSTVNGYLNKYAVRPGESVIFTTNGLGEGIVRAKYGNVSYSITIVNLKVDTNLTAEDVVAMYNDDSRLIAELKDGDGNPISGAEVKFTIGSLTKTMNTSSSGKAFISTKSLAPGDYVATVSYDGDDYHTSASTAANVTVIIRTVLTAEDVSGVYHNGTRLVATLKDANGNALSNEEVTVTIDGRGWDLTTNSKGVVRFLTDRLDVGNYTAVIAYDGTTYYCASNTTANILIKICTTLSASKLTTVYGSGDEFVVTLNDANGNPIGDADIAIALGDINTTVVTGSDGKASLDVSAFTPKVYYATIYYAGEGIYNASVKENVKVYVQKISTYLTSSDVIGMYHNGTRLVATLKDADGNALSNEKVTVTIDGNKWDLTTNSKGVVRFLTDRLDAGNYTAEIAYKATTYYYGSSTIANILIVEDKINTALAASKLTTVYGSGDELVVTLNNAYGNPIKGADVVIALGDINTTVVTGADGKARLDVTTFTPKVYYATIYYAGNNLYNPSVKDNVKVYVQKISTALAAADVSGVYHNGTRLVTTLKDANGNPLSNEKVTVTIDGRSWDLTTNSKGVVRFLTDRLDVGNYTAEISYKATTYYYASSTTANVLIKVCTSLSASKITAVYGSGDKFVVTLKDANGNPIKGADLVIALDDVNTTVVTGADGKARLDVSTLTPKVYYATIYYAGEGIYNASVKENVKVYVQKISTALAAADVSGAYHSGTRLVATLKDDDGNALSNEMVTVTIDGNKWDLTTNSKGVVRFLTDRLEVGNYTAEIAYKASTYYYASSATANIEIF